MTASMFVTFEHFSLHHLAAARPSVIAYPDSLTYAKTEDASHALHGWIVGL
jgi:hypothetical protein